MRPRVTSAARRLATKAPPALQFHQGWRRHYRKAEVTRSGCCPRAIPVCALSHVRSDRANKHQPIASPCYLPADNMTWDGLHHWFARPGEATAEDLLRGRRTVAAALVTARSSGVVASHTPPYRKQPAKRSPATALPSVSGCPTRPHANDHFARSNIADGWLTPCPLRSRIIPLDVVARWRLYRNKAEVTWGTRNCGYNPRQGTQRGKGWHYHREEVTRRRHYPTAEVTPAVAHSHFTPRGTLTLTPTKNKKKRNKANPGT